jgi:hypothetical protein
MSRIVACSILLFCIISHAFSLPAKAPKRSYFEIRVYHFGNQQQENVLDNYLKNALVPALHRNKIREIGVFKALENDTAADKKIYVLIPYKSLDQFLEMAGKLQKDNAYQQAGSEYINAPYTQPVYTRMETILLKAFSGMPFLAKPNLDNTREDNVYELRSYEGHTEKIYHNKVDMFNKGDEIGLFKRLGFNAVFYGEVVAGARMPNLMYMTSFNNKQERDAHWKTFIDDSQWKKLSSDPGYQHNVSKIDIYFLRATDYSDL